MKTKTLGEYPLLIGEVLRRNYARRFRRELRRFKQRNSWWNRLLRFLFRL